MVRWARVIWTGGRSEVYHRKAGLRWDQDQASARCGQVVDAPRKPSREGTAYQAAALGLRPCRRCFSETLDRVPTGE